MRKIIITLFTLIILYIVIVSLVAKPKTYESFELSPVRDKLPRYDSFFITGLYMFAHDKIIIEVLTNDRHGLNYSAWKQDALDDLKLGSLALINAGIKDAGVIHHFQSAYLKIHKNGYRLKIREMLNNKEPLYIRSPNTDQEGTFEASLVYDKLPRYDSFFFTGLSEFSPKKLIIEASEINTESLNVNKEYTDDIMLGAIALNKAGIEEKGVIEHFQSAYTKLYKLGYQLKIREKAI